MLQCLNVEENRELRDFFVESGYNTQALTKVFGHTEIPQVHLLKLFVVGITLEPTRLNVLFRWFWIGSSVDEATTRAVIPERILLLLLKSGLVIEEENGFTSPIRISPFENFLILSDHAVARKGALRTDTVLWPNPTSMLCHHLSMQTPFGRTLDLGTGNGILALATSTHSGSVIATDLNARAREFCEFNAALNGVTNIEFREGSAYEPVSEDRFDLILANPPFFVTPTVRRVYSDNGMELDGFCRKLVREAHEHLNDGGYCQMLLEWVEMKGQPWRERLAEWFKDTGCDAWVLTTYMRSSVDYSLIRVQEDREEQMSADEQGALISTWQKYFENLGVEAIYGGMIVLRRREGPNWVRMEELQSMPMRPFGDFMRRIFDSRDFLGCRSDDEVLQSRPTLPAAVRLQKQFAMSPEGWKLSSMDLFAGEGLPYSLTLQPQVADFVSRCDGKRTLGEIADHTAAALSVDPALVRREICNVVRRLADRGMMVF